MIKLLNLNKYFYRGKTNEIHVINNISLEFPDTGLVCLLGPSGCGKTTLLNVIGGLDRPDAGEIYYQNKLVTKKNIDEIRISDVGFVFQNYVLFPKQTVYDNLKLVLDLFELDLAEIDRRIEYALKAVGMEKYKKRPAGQLSGGQMQRVAIARALVKSPSVIIADEPTGNLDEKNTQQIMNIIKKLSSECLVILVTHEQRLADFYSDRIIKILDGKIISDDINQGSLSLLEKDDTNIYLKELDHIAYQEEDVLIRYFFKKERPQLKVDIVFQNNTFFIKPYSTNAKHSFKLVDGGSETLIVDSNKPEISLDEIENFDYDLPEIANKQTKKTSMRWKDSFKMAINYLRSLRFRKKLFLLVFVLSAMMVVFASATLAKGLIIRPTDFQTYDRDTIYIDDLGNLEIDEIIELEGKLNTDGLVPVSTMHFNFFTFTDFAQTANQMFSFYDHGIAPITTLDEDGIFLGRYPQSSREVVIDKWLLDQINTSNSLSVSPFSMAGYSDYQQMIGEHIFFSLYSGFQDDDSSVTIVGIADTNNPVIYCSYDAAYSAYLTNYNYISVYKGIKTGIASATYAGIETFKDLDGNTHNISDFDSQNGVLVYESYFTDFGSFGQTPSLTLSPNEYGINEIEKVEYNIVGTFSDDYDYTVIATPKLIKQMVYRTIAIDNECVFISSDMASDINYLRSQGYSCVDAYEYSHDNYRKQTLSSIITLLTIAIVFMVSSLLFLYFTMRSSLISRVYEIGVYRALGIKKRDICKLFILEIIMISIVTSLVGYLLASFIVIELQSSLMSFLVFYPWYIALGAFVVIFGFNFLIGVLPISRLLRLTPAQILSKYDI